MPGFVYGVRDISTDTIIYIGSCIRQYLSQRIGDHRKPSNKSNIFFYKFIQENGGWDNFEFLPIEEYESITRIDLLKREKHFINTLYPICNQISPITTHEEFNERKRITAKEWRKQNPDKVKEQKRRAQEKESYQEMVLKRCSTHIECECGGRYTLQNKTNHLNREIHKRWVNTNSSV